MPLAAITACDVATRHRFLLLESLALESHRPQEQSLPGHLMAFIICLGERKETLEPVCDSWRAEKSSPHTRGAAGGSAGGLGAWSPSEARSPTLYPASTQGSAPLHVPLCQLTPGPAAAPLEVTMTRKRTWLALSGTTQHGSLLDTDQLTAPSSGPGRELLWHQEGSHRSRSITDSSRRS